MPHKPAAILRLTLNSPLLIITLALVIRVMYLIQYYKSPFFHAPMWDAGEYHEIALALAGGELHPALPYRPPLYPVMLGIVYMLFGSGALVPRLLQIAMGTAACVLVMRIGTLVFDRTVGWWAGMVAACAGLMIYFDLELLPTSLEVFTALALLYELLKFKEGGGSGVRAGVWFALATLTRPTMLPFLPVAVWWLIRTRAGQRTTGWFIAAAGLPLLLSLALHVAAGSGWVLVSAQGGVNFYIGNHRGADGMTAALPGVGAGWDWAAVESMAGASMEGKPNPAAVDRFFWQMGLAEIRSDPVEWAGLMLHKAALFFNRVEISNNRDLYYHAAQFNTVGVFLWLGFALLLPLAGVGLVAGRCGRRGALIAAFIAVYFLAVIPFFVNARFRHTLTPLLAIFAAGGVVWVLRGIGGRQMKFQTAGAAAAAFAIGLILPRIADSGIDTRRFDYGLFTEGKALESLVREEEALGFYRRALAANPGAPYVNNHIAEIMRHRLQFGEAVEYYQRELAIQPGYAKAWNNLGVAWDAMGELRRALECFERAVSIAPAAGEYSRNVARALGRLGDEALRAGDFLTAREYYRRAAERDSGNPALKERSLIFDH